MTKYCLFGLFHLFFGPAREPNKTIIKPAGADSVSLVCNNPLGFKEIMKFARFFLVCKFYYNIVRMSMDYIEPQILQEIFKRVFSFFDFSD